MIYFIILKFKDHQSLDFKIVILIVIIISIILSENCILRENILKELLLIILFNININNSFSIAF